MSDVKDEDDFMRYFNGCTRLRAERDAARAENERLTKGHEILNAALGATSDDVIMLQERLTRVVEGRKLLRAENESLWRVVAAARDDLKCNRDAYRNIFQDTDSEWPSGCTETEKNLIAAIANLASLPPRDVKEEKT